MTDPLQRARGLVRQNRILDAEPLLDRLLEGSPTDTDALYLRGVCHFRRKDFPAAEAAFRRLLTEDNTHANGHYYLGLCLERQDNETASLEQYHFVLALQPDHRQALSKLGATAADGNTDGPRPREGGTGPIEETSPDPGQRILEGHRLFRTTLPLSVLPVLVFAAILAKLASLGLGIPGFGVFIGALLLLSPVDAWLRSRATRYVVWQRRLDLQQGIVFRKEHSVWTYEIENVEFSRGFWLMLMRSGRITIEAKGQKHRIVGLGNHRFMRKLWNELRDAALVQRRGMKKWWI